MTRSRYRIIHAKYSIIGFICYTMIWVGAKYDGVAAMLCLMLGSCIAGYLSYHAADMIALHELAERSEKDESREKKQEMESMALIVRKPPICPDHQTPCVFAEYDDNGTPLYLWECRQPKTEKQNKIEGLKDFPHCFYHVHCDKKGREIE